MADDDVVIRRRLLTRTSTVGKSGLKKCAEVMLTLIDLLTDESVDDATCKQEMSTFFWELEQLQFEANKTEIWNFTCDRELEEYETLNSEIDTSIAKAAKDIEDLQVKIRAEKTVRAYKEEYESIAKVINKLPSRKEIETEIEKQKKILSDVSMAIEAVDGRLDLRTKQFALLMNTIQNLKATLNEDAVLDEEMQEEDEEMVDVENKNTTEKEAAGQSSPASS
ncbi:tho complex subunit 7 homolog [Plasmopara halstedii]|uniref:Tho complex subunit 7 homolog n=1 Tax=Plasmopara halstedii TaxID=4781 RepID=A0A0P1AVV7_PLAHL|nr:tho complex subunit 7 homolog [Plasmopara halstedii]CEG46484.1 tho complex subunit 7 homolog [Plasmopara halstedii]|eukprot:XP_024582853.1 tho complex subunit 7 homolog [Plasmopara halstedii]